MNFDYEAYLLSKLTAIQEDQGLSDFNFEIETEQAFIKRKDYDPNTIYIIIKYLADNKQFNATQQPIQLLILTEQNSLDVSKIIFDKFTQDYNWKVEIQGTTYVKQQYSQPVVLSNFNPVAYGYRSVMYVSTTLYVLEGFIDVTDFKIDTKSIELINFSLNYSMTTNTQQKQGENIASSVKNVSSLTITISTPIVSGTLLTNISNTLSGSYSGNQNYTITYKIGTSSFSYNMKLTSCQIITAPNQVPSLQLGFMK